MLFSMISGAGLLSAYGRSLKDFFRKSTIHRISLSKLSSGIYSDKRFIIFRKDKNITVLSRKCPHLGCELQIDERHGQIACPCHGSRFKLTGKYIGGPAQKDMSLYKYKLDSNNIIITTVE